MEQRRRSERMRDNRGEYARGLQRQTEPETKHGIVEGAALLNVRSEPDRTRNNVIGTLGRGEHVTIVGERDGYYKIEVSIGRTDKAMLDGGYIVSEFCKILEE